MAKLLYRVLFRDERSVRFLGFDAAAGAHEWVRRRHPGRDYAVRTEPVNAFVYPLTLRPTKERICRPPSSITAVVLALVVLGALSSAVSGRSDDVRMRTNAPRSERAVAQCKDGTYSENTEFWNTCRGASGIRRWLAPAVLCNDGRTLELNERASCGEAGVDRLLTGDATPSTTAPTTPGPSVVSPTMAAEQATVRSAALRTATPAVAPSCSAAISNARPARGSTVMVSVTSNQPNASAQLSINYRTTTMKEVATTDATGRADVLVAIGAATIGYTVGVVIAVGEARCDTAFTPAT